MNPRPRGTSAAGALCAAPRDVAAGSGALRVLAGARPGGGGGRGAGDTHQSLEIPGRAQGSGRGAPWLFTIVRREHARLYERKRLPTVDVEEVEALGDPALASDGDAGLMICAARSCNCRMNTGSRW